MADITMCDNQECTVRSGCYRARATQSAWQSWAIFQPESDGKCDHFIKYVEHTKEAERSKTF